jgi:hypothetical protein
MVRYPRSLLIGIILRAVQGETFACSHARQSVGKCKPENPRSGERGYVSFLAVRSIFINQTSVNRK